METKIEDIMRVGTDYYLVDSVPSIDGTSKKSLIKWNRASIIDDFGKGSVNEVVKYKAFCSIPSHTNYRQVIDSCYNNYHRVSHVLKLGKFVNTKHFLKHIFGDQYELGLDYLGILWHYPSHILPILSLVSNERNTGKTTFLNWIKAIFENNMTINKNEDFRSQFNSDWANKLIVGIDEVLLEKKEDSELLKSLSTARYSKSEAKGKDKQEIDFFGKFILCTNNEDNFVKIDNEEIRYWVRKVPKLKEDNPFLLDKLVSEIPNFLSFINNRTIVSQKRTRMWFSPQQLWTPALDTLKKGNKTFNEKQLLESIEDELERFELKEVKFSVGDLVELMNKNNLRIPGIQITKLLIEKWKLQSKNSTYKKYYHSFDHQTDEYVVASTKMKNRHYIFSKEILHNIKNKNH
jgi:hypothetical protein